MKGFKTLLAVIEMYLGNQEIIRQKMCCILLAVPLLALPLKSDIDLSSFMFRRKEKSENQIIPAHVSL